MKVVGKDKLAKSVDACRSCIHIKSIVTRTPSTVLATVATYIDSRPVPGNRKPPIAAPILISKVHKVKRATTGEE